MKSSILLLLLGVSSLFLVWEMLLTSGKSMNLVFIAIENSRLFKNFPSISRERKNQGLDISAFLTPHPLGFFLN